MILSILLFTEGQTKMKKYVIVGCGSRGIGAYAIPLIKDYEDCAQLCGVYDNNRNRAEVVSKKVGKDIPVFDDFDKMLEEAKPDTVIVTSKDCTHDYYIIKAMEFGCDVISEKPVTTDFEKANALINAKRRTGKELTVTFNLRYSPFCARVKELVASGAIGTILSVHFEWMLDTKHGADYFRRWHRERENSGSLLVHKSTHHFDYVNWLLEEEPVAVNAFGTKRFYGHTREERAERCLECPYKKQCEYPLDITKGEYKDLYLDCESADGYFRDKCIFSDEINIEDSISVNVQYSGGAVMSYSLTAHSPYEGYHLVLNGTKGRMEVDKLSTELPGYNEQSQEEIRVYNRLGEVITYSIPKRKSEGHGGSDDIMRDKIFRGTEIRPELKQAASLRAGLMSIGIGMTANVSMKENRRVFISEFYKEIDDIK